MWMSQGSVLEHMPRWSTGEDGRPPYGPMASTTSISRSSVCVRFCRREAACLHARVRAGGERWSGLLPYSEAYSKLSARYGWRADMKRTRLSLFIGTMMALYSAAGATFAPADITELPPGAHPYSVVRPLQGVSHRAVERAVAPSATLPLWSY